MGFLLRVFLVIGCFGCFLYAYLEKQNAITQLRLEIPLLKQEFEQIAQENTRLQYEIDHFEDPSHLMELSRKPEYRHLKYPLQKDILTIPKNLKEE